MLKRFSLWSLLLVGLLGWSQYFQYTADLKWNDDTKCYVGFTNTTKTPASATLTGYTSTGEILGTLSLDIAGLGRKSFGCFELFNTATLAFLKVSSNVELGSYVLYKSQNMLSSLPFTSVPGPQVLVPHIARDTDVFFTETVIANFSTTKLGVYSQPYMDPSDPSNLTPEQLLEPLAIASEQDQKAQSRFFYESLYPELTPSLQWDIIKSSDVQGLVGVEHFGKAGQQRASLALSRSPFQELIISHISHDQAHFWTGLVLVNTKDGIVPVTIQSYMEDGTPFQTVHFDMQPFEKKTYLLRDGEELGLSDVASWLKVTPFEQAVIGYEIFGSPDQTFLAGMEPAMNPSNMVSLPFTPTDDEHWSGFGIINPTDEQICVQIGGLDDDGNIVSHYDCKRMDPHSKFITTLEDFFGDSAKDITWVLLNTERGNLSGFSLVGNHERTTLAGLQGFSTYSKEGTIFSANFEHDAIESLLDQGWKETRFDIDWPWAELYHFSIEPYYEAVNGVTHLQARTFPVKVFNNLDYVPQVAFISPFFDIPVNRQELFLSYYLRIIDPETTVEGSHYGIIWREEGTSTWNWSGITGTYILERLHTIAFFSEPQVWNLEVHEMTRWLPFQVQLPASLAGKRIQVGLWCDTPMPEPDPDITTPYLWCDFIRVTTNPVIPEHLQLRDPKGSGSFNFYLP